MMPIDSLTFRQVVGHFATGVSVVTTRLGEVVYGMTVNAFSSLSLEPTLVLICIDHKARMKPLLDASGVFAVNILAEDQVELSRIFASKYVDLAERFRSASHRNGVTGSPLIDGCVAFLDCRVVATHPSGDHTIYIGEVQEAGLGPKARPLLYYQGQYRAIEE